VEVPSDFCALDEFVPTERELAHSKFTEKRMKDGFYRDLGKTIVNRFFILIGMFAVGLAFGKGWISGDMFSNLK